MSGGSPERMPDMTSKPSKKNAAKPLLNKLVMHHATSAEHFISMVMNHMQMGDAHHDGPCKISGETLDRILVSGAQQTDPIAVLRFGHDGALLDQHSKPQEVNVAALVWKDRSVAIAACDASLAGDLPFCPGLRWTFLPHAWRMAMNPAVGAQKFRLALRPHQRLNEHLTPYLVTKSKDAISLRHQENAEARAIRDRMHGEIVRILAEPCAPTGLRRMYKPWSKDDENRIHGLLSAILCAIDGREIALHDERLIVSLNDKTTLTLVSATNEPNHTKSHAVLNAEHVSGQSSKGSIMNQLNKKVFNDIVAEIIALDHEKFTGWNSKTMSSKRLTFRQAIEIGQARWEEMTTGHARMRALAHPRFNEIVARLESAKTAAV